MSINPQSYTKSDVQKGKEADLPPHPLEGEIFITTDTDKLCICFKKGEWVKQPIPIKMPAGLYLQKMDSHSANAITTTQTNISLNKPDEADTMYIVPLSAYFTHGSTSLNMEAIMSIGSAKITSQLISSSGVAHIDNLVKNVMCAEMPASKTIPVVHNANNIQAATSFMVYWYKRVIE